MIRCQALIKSFRARGTRVKALNGLDLEVRAGEFVTIRGPSGCGKSTLLLTLGGMLRPTSGRVWLGGQDLYSLSGDARSRLRATRVSFVFQMFHLVPYLTALENVLLAAPGPAATSSGDGQAARTRARELFQQFGLGDRMHHTPAQLSAGERQRTALARALLPQPRVILADEPTGMLDDENARAVLDCLKRFHADGGTIVVATHGTQPDGYADRTLLMRAGLIEGKEA